MARREPDSLVLSAKKIRADLKENFPEIKFKVRVDRFSLGEAIDIHWIDGPTSEQVKPFLSTHEHVRRCEFSGEILGGGNTYVHGHRSMSDEARALVIEIRDRTYDQKSYCSNGYNSWDDLVWRVFSKTDFTKLDESYYFGATPVSALLAEAA